MELSAPVSGGLSGTGEFINTTPLKRQNPQHHNVQGMSRIGRLPHVLVLISSVILVSLPLI